jgi:class 3 adenylate cyclase/tetratricopeptide (TPR) repeat protein/Cdc6-like AAA superfamily ATPase
MRNLLPDLKLLGYSEDNKAGAIKGSVLFVDISGFTSMTRKLMAQGKEGAEILSDMMNRLFSPLIDSVYDHGGFIINFAGDAFTAVFKADNGFVAAAVAKDIVQFFKENPVFEYSGFSFSLSAKTGISCGDLKWMSVLSNGPEHFFFFGDAIDEAAEAEHACKANDISVTEKVYANLEADGSFNLKGKDIFLVELFSLPKSKPLVPELDLETLKKFIPQIVIDHSTSGEFREVVSVFISYEIGGNTDDINSVLSFFATGIQKYGGYISGFDFGDKGATVLALFGAPVSYEDNLERALNCIVEMRKKSPVEFRSGVTEGTVYAGFTGSVRRSAYTALGDNVNLSARLMMAAPFGYDWTLGRAACRAKIDYELHDAGKHKFKGIDEEIEVFTVVKRQEKESIVSYKTAMTGRQKELAEATDLCRKAFRDSSLHIHTIYGEAGIGKSRLVYEVIKKLADESTVYRFTADTILRQSMNMFNSFFQRFFNQSDTLSESDNMLNFEKKWGTLLENIGSTEEFENTKPYIAALSGIVIKGSVYEILDAKSRYENTIFAISDFFGLLGSSRNTIMVLDDLHAVDKDSLEALRAMLKKVGGIRTAVIILSRLNDDGTKPDFSLGSYSSSELVMDRLTSSDIPSFVQNVLEGNSSSGLNEFVFKRSAGNPFFIEQLLLYMKENNYILSSDDVFKLSKSDVEVPGEVNSILVSRLDRLSYKLKDVVFRASVLGNDIDLNILKDITPENSFKSILKEGSDQLIWTSVSDLFYAFRHALLRDAAYNMQLKSRLREIHSKVAKAIEINYPGEERFFSSIAFHYDKAENRDKTILYLRKAAEYAKSQYHNADAELLYERLMELLTKEEEIIETGHILGSVYKVSGKWDHAEKLFKDCLEKAENLKNELLVASSMKELGYMLLEKGRYDEAQPLLDSAVKLFRKSNAVKGEGDVEGYRGLIHYYKGELDDAIEHFSRKLKLAEQIDDKAAKALSYRYLGGVSYYRSDYKTAHGYYLKQLEMSKESENILDIAAAESNLGLVYSHMNDLNNAAAYYQNALDTFKKIGMRQYICNTSNNLGELKFWLGEYDEARKLFENQLQIATELGIKRHISIAYNYLGNICRINNLFDQALEYYDKAIIIGEELNVQTILCEYYYEKAYLFYEMERFDEALELSEKAMKMSVEVNRKDFEFKSELLKWLAISKKNTQGAVTKLKELVSDCTKDENIAELNYHLFILTNDRQYAVKAIELFKTLYSIAPKAAYKEKIDSLKSINPDF